MSKPTLAKMRKKRFRLICDDLFHEQHNSHKGWCYRLVRGNDDD